MIDKDLCEKYLKTIFEDIPAKIVISKPPAGSDFFRIRAVRTDKGYLFEKFTEKQVFHEDLTAEKAAARCMDLISYG